MALWQDSFQDWARAWASLQDLQYRGSGATATLGSTQLMVWPGGAEADGAEVDSAEADGAEAGGAGGPQAVGAGELILVTEDPEGATAFARSQGLRSAGHQVLMCAVTEELDLVPELPSDAYLAEAPMENYDLVEVALFDRPVARGRLSRHEDLGVLAALDVDPGHDDMTPVFEQAMAAGLGEEAFTHGADTLFLIAGAEQAERFAAVEGWHQVAEILSFTQ